MKRFFMAVLTFALLASSAMAANVASVTEEFRTLGTSTPAVVIFNNRTTVTPHENPSSTYSPGGFKYGGWCVGPVNDTTNNYFVQFAGQGSPGYSPAVPILQCKPSAAVAGSYFYTIFDSTGGATPSSTVANAFSVTLVTPKANAATEVNDADFAILLRDDTGAWFQQVDGLQTVSMTNGVENTYKIMLAGKNFQQLTGSAPTDMNEMDAGTAAADFTPGAITLSGTNVPAPANVTGFGLIQMSALSGGGASNTAPIKFRSFTVASATPAELDVFESDGTTAIASGGTLDLGSVEVGASMTGSLVLKNTGDLNLTLGTVAAVGATLTDDPSAAAIAGLAQDTLGFSVNTSVIGPVSGSITIPSDDADEGSYVVNFTGTVTPVQVASITESFKSFSSGDVSKPKPADINFFNWRTNTGSAAVTNVSGEHPKRGYGANALGFKYGGWAPGTGQTTNNFSLAFGSQGTPGYSPSVEILNIKLTVAKASAYIYTIFDTTGGANPTHAVNNAASVRLVTAKANGTAAASGFTPEEMSADVGLLLRDAAGKWYKQMDGFQTVTMKFGVENTHYITLAGKNFQEVTGAAPADWNQMDEESATNASTAIPGAIASLSGVDVPAPTNVTGMGIVLATDAVLLDPSLTGVGGIKLVEYSVSNSLPPAAELDIFEADGTTPVASGGTMVDLGSVAQGGSMTGSLVLKNTGSSNLTLGTVVAVGATLTDDPSGAVIAGSAQDTLGFSVSTAAVGPVSGSITIPSDDADEGSYVVNFTGTVTAPLVPELDVFESDGTTAVANGGTIALGSVNVGGSLTGNLVLKNTGTGALTLGTVAATGATLTDNPSAAVIAAAGQDTLGFSVDTSTPGAVSGSITIPSDDADEGSYVVNFTGDVVAVPGVAVTVNSNPVADGATTAVSLGSYEVGETATDVVFTVTNSGSLALTVSGITVPAGVTIVEDLTAGDIAPSASDTFKVKIDTTAEVTITGEISFTTNVTGAETFNFAVSGDVGPVTAVRRWEQY